MKLLMLVVSLAISGADAFTPAPLNHPLLGAPAVMFAEMDRRSMLGSAAASLAFLALQQPALAEDEAAAAATATTIQHIARPR